MITRYNSNSCRDAYLIARNPHLTEARREDATREFCMELWFYVCPDNADEDMVKAVVPYLTNCAYLCNDEDDFEVIANGMRNAYYDGMYQGAIDGRR